MLPANLGELEFGFFDMRDQENWETRQIAHA